MNPGSTANCNLMDINKVRYIDSRGLRKFYKKHKNCAKVLIWAINLSMKNNNIMKETVKHRVSKWITYKSWCIKNEGCKLLLVFY
jgi:hypothetical protein